MHQVSPLQNACRQCQQATETLEHMNSGSIILSIVQLPCVLCGHRVALRLMSHDADACRGCDNCACLTVPKLDYPRPRNFPVVFTVVLLAFLLGMITVMSTVLLLDCLCSVLSRLLQQAAKSLRRAHRRCSNTDAPCLPIIFTSAILCNTRNLPLPSQPRPLSRADRIFKPKYVTSKS